MKLNKCCKCGKPAKLVFTHHTYDMYMLMYMVQCSLCRNETEKFRTEKEAITSWNIKN